MTPRYGNDPKGWQMVQVIVYRWIFYFKAAFYGRFGLQSYLCMCIAGPFRVVATRDSCNFSSQVGGIVSWFPWRTLPRATSIQACHIAGIAQNIQSVAVFKDFLPKEIAGEVDLLTRQLFENLQALVANQNTPSWYKPGEGEKESARSESESSFDVVDDAKERSY